MPPTSKLTTHEVNVLNWVEQIYITTNKYPTQEEYEEHFPESEQSLAKFKMKPLFRRALENRGIIDVKEHKLTAEQLAAIAAFTDIKDKRTVYNKLRTIGITTRKWNGWMREPKFKQAVLKIVNSQFEDAKHLAQMGLMNGIEEGNVNALRLYYELIGEIGSGRNTGQEELENVKLVIAKLTEVLQTHITDPELLGLIYRDFEAVLHGRKLVPSERAGEIEASPAN